MQNVSIEQERKFNIMRNPAGDLMILLRARMEDAVEPKIAYDGGDHALLYRNDDSMIVLDFIHPAIREDLGRVERLLVVEARDGAIVREYMVSVKHLKKVPIPKDLVVH